MSKPSLPKELQGLLRQNSTLAPLAKAARGRKAAAPKGPAAPPQDCLPPALRDRVTLDVAAMDIEFKAAEAESEGDYKAERKQYLSKRRGLFKQIREGRSPVV